MSPDTILELRNVSVRYRFRRSFFRHEYFTALDDVSFDLKRHETLGVIGANGSGKSTLLRVLAGIFGVDSGSIGWNCDQVLMLSIALGFDEELSGRDNAIISGMLLGARKREMLEQLARIIEFSELQEFINKPIKTYSSGMRARLGFSVALCVHPDVLLIDEILGVGDGAFQIKAEKAIVERMISQDSVVLVSHNLEQLEKLSDRVLWLEHGKVQAIGEPGQVIRDYHQFLKSR